MLDEQNFQYKEWLNELIGAIYEYLDETSMVYQLAEEIDEKLDKTKENEHE